MQKNVSICLSECEEDHFLPLINLGESLQNDGIDVTFIVCAHGPCPGSSNIFFDVFDSVCARQRALIISLLQDRCLKHVSMLEEVSDNQISASRATLEQLENDDFQQTVYLGYNLWDIVKGTVCRYLQKTKMFPDDLTVIRRFFSTAILYLDTLPDLFSSLQPNVLIIFNGMPLFDRVAREVATTLGIHVFAEENSCFADRKFLDPTGIVINRHLFARRETWDAIRGRNLDDGQAARLAAYLEEVYAGRVNTISQCPADSHANVFGRLGFAPDRPLAILLSQVPFDSVIVNDSPLYSDIVDFICDVMNIFAGRPEWGLIVRLHPIEERLYGNPTLKRLQEGSIPENVRIVHGTRLNTYVLMDCCRFALTINSQSGLEMLSKHKPVIVSGNAFYGGKGFTEDVRSREELVDAVGKLCATPRLTDVQGRLADVFLYYFLFDYLIPYDRSSHRFGREAADIVLRTVQHHSLPAGNADHGTLREGSVASAARRTQELYLMGVQRGGEGLVGEALQAFRSADAIVVAEGIPEERIELLVRQTELLLEMDLVADAEQANDQLNGIRKGEWYYWALLQAYRKRNDHKAVMRLLRKYLESHPGDHTYRFEFGIELERIGEWREAWEQFDQLLSACPEHLDAFFHRERIGKRAGTGADGVTARPVPLPPPIAPYIRLVVRIIRNGDVLDALKRAYVVLWVCSQRLMRLPGKRI